MADDTLKVSSPGPAPANIPTLDGAADRPPTTQQELPTAPLSRPAPIAQLADNDTLMTSPTSTRPTITAAPGAPPTPEASPRAPAANIKPSGPVPLDSPLRTKPIHPSLPSVKVPDTSSPNMNPITLQPFTQAELSKHGYEKLRNDIYAAGLIGLPTGMAVNHRMGKGDAMPLTDRESKELNRLREETALALKHRLDERDSKAREIEREMEEKEKIREVERKVFRKKLAGGKEA